MHMLLKMTVLYTNEGKIIQVEGRIFYIVQRSKAKLNSQGGFDQNVILP